MWLTVTMSPDSQSWSGQRSKNWIGYKDTHKTLQWDPWSAAWVSVYNCVAHSFFLFHVQNSFLSKLEYTAAQAVTVHFHC